MSDSEFFSTDVYYLDRHVDVELFGASNILSALEQQAHTQIKAKIEAAGWRKHRLLLFVYDAESLKMESFYLDTRVVRAMLNEGVLYVSA